MLFERALLGAGAEDQFETDPGDQGAGLLVALEQAGQDIETQSTGTVPGPSQGQEAEDLGRTVTAVRPGLVEEALVAHGGAAAPADPAQPLARGVLSVDEDQGDGGGEGVVEVPAGHLMGQAHGEVHVGGVAEQAEGEQFGGQGLSAAAERGLPDGLAHRGRGRARGGAQVLGEQDLGGRGDLGDDALGLGGQEGEQVAHPLPRPVHPAAVPFVVQEGDQVGDTGEHGLVGVQFGLEEGDTVVGLQHRETVAHAVVVLFVGCLLAPGPVLGAHLLQIVGGGPGHLVTPLREVGGLGKTVLRVRGDQFQQEAEGAPPVHVGGLRGDREVDEAVDDLGRGTVAGGGEADDVVEVGQRSIAGRGRFEQLGDAFSALGREGGPVDLGGVIVFFVSRGRVHTPIIPAREGCAHRRGRGSHGGPIRCRWGRGGRAAGGPAGSGRRAGPWPPRGSRAGSR